MFRITEDPSSGSIVQCLAKNYKNGSIVSIDMDVVGVMAAYSDPLCVCVVHCIGRHSWESSYIVYSWKNKEFDIINARCNHDDVRQMFACPDSAIGFIQTYFY